MKVSTHLHPDWSLCHERPRVTFALSVVGLVSVAAGCASAPAEDVASGEGSALSASVCTPKATDYKNKVFSDCAGASFDYSACAKPAYDAYSVYLAQVETAYQAATAKAVASNASWVAVDQSCASDVKNEDCAKVLDEDAFESAKFKNGKGDQAKCDTAKADAIQSCHDRSKDEAAQDPSTDPQNDSAYAQLNGQWAAKRAAWAGSIISCGARKAADVAKDSAYCGTKANAAYASSYASCRHECPNDSHAACTPDDYKGQDVKCGTLESDTGFFGITCESSYKCARTSVCDDYDRAIDQSSSGGRCPSGKVKRFTVTTKASGKSQIPDAVQIDCVAAASN